MKPENLKDRAISHTWGYVSIALGTLIFIVAFALSGAAASILGLPDISGGVWIGLALVVVGFIILTGDDEPRDQ